jgi:hypothetical protein
VEERRGVALGFPPLCFDLCEQRSRGRGCGGRPGVGVKRAELQLALHSDLMCELKILIKTCSC